ncbi:MAG: beta-aspartyl-peptidase [Bacteroidetes bacterium]|nr:MAG: beta-aspartyl-peptidase [Bacteroidota bacterium]
MLLLKNCELYAPEKSGIKDILIAGNQIIAVEESIPVPQGLEVKVMDLKGFRVIPGLIDAHVHIAGAGGEGGPASRTPEMQLSHMLEAGVTTVIGCLGTDGMTRNLESVLMKVKALRQEGVSAWMYTGSYQVPTPTIMGDVGKDIALIEEIIGVGEIAISDHRSSFPSAHELIRLAGHARVGGMLGGKCGIVNIHMGDAKSPFKPLYEIVAMSELSFKQFLPTHINRNSYIFEDAKTYGKKGYIDITASSYPYFPQYEVKPSKAIAGLLKSGVPLKHITMTSDACGSLPDFDENGKLVSLKMGYPKSVFDEIADTVREEKIDLELALTVATSNIADILWLKNKGRIEVAKDADLVVLDQDFNIIHLVAMGKLMVENSKMLKKGSYEQ